MSWYLWFFLRLRNTVKLAPKGLPGQARSPGVVILLETTTGDVIPLD